jgi:uncharacterized protein
MSHYQVAPLLSAAAAPVMPVSLDLGLHYRGAPLDAGWMLPNGQVLTTEQLKHPIRPKQLLSSQRARVGKDPNILPPHQPLLQPDAHPHAPTLLISGIPMHRIKDTTPLLDTRQKLKALGKPYGRILDTATGLGYTAIQAAQTANQVITIEFDPAVHDICRLNPWSAELFTKPASSR